MMLANFLFRRLPKQQNPQAPRQLVDPRRPIPRLLLRRPRRRRRPPPRQQRQRLRPRRKLTLRPNVWRKHLQWYVIVLQRAPSTTADYLDQAPAIVKETTISAKTASGRITKGPAKTAGAVQKKKPAPKAKKAATPKKPKATPKKTETPAAAA